MSTLGLKVYKWQGRHYVYYKLGHPSPSGFGREVVGEIPSNSERYQAWLQQMRAKYSALAQKLERFFSVRMTDTHLLDHTREPDADLDKLERMPSYLAPEVDRSYPWIYLIDLDREQFGINGACFYRLSKVPPYFEDIIKDAQNVWLGELRQDKDEVDESITTNDVYPAPLTNDPTPAFLQMRPTTIQPKQESRLNLMPTFIACKRLYDVFLTRFEKLIRQAQDTLTESDFLFRELVFALMCFASCSPEWVRFIAITHMMLMSGTKSFTSDFGADGYYDTTEWEPREFMTRFLHGYHLEGMEAGSAPKSSSYWFSGALVYLRRDIISRERFHDAIISAVAKAKEDGRTQFSAIIVSLKHFVLLKFADGRVQHTNRLKFGSCPKVVREAVIQFDQDNVQHESGGAREFDREETTDDCSDDSDWADNSDVPTFEILAHFFDATERESLKPSIIHNEGVFPNEVYQKILSHVDRETNIACRMVSRYFRECASEAFFMDDNRMKLVYRPGQEPECFHDSFGFMGPFNLLSSRDFNRLYKDDVLRWCIQMIPVFGNPDGSASMESDIKLVFPLLEWGGSYNGFVVERLDRW